MSVGCVNDNHYHADDMTRGEKKSIVNKIVLESAVTCLMWPPAQSHYIFGLADGKVTTIICYY